MFTIFFVEEKKREKFMKKIASLLEKVFSGIAIAIVAIVAHVIVCTITAVPVYFLWNWLIPELFNLPTLTFIQAIGMTLLCHLLFGSSHSRKED